jgi:DMSO/TMAO reductase YedYZ molybdopterin-dependent catalytic subunit
MIDRRRFLLTGGSSVAAAWLAACNSDGPRSAERILRYAERKNEIVERGLFRHTSMDVAGRDVPDTGAAFPSYYVAPTVPVWNEAAAGPWMLDVGGMVAKPMRFSLPDLQRLPGVTQRVNHYCVEGWTAIASWTGVRLRDLAALVQPSPDAHYVDFQSFDAGYHESWDIESATHPQTLIAYGVDGGMLGPAHGGPARIYSPVKLGYKNTKYLTRVVFLPVRNGGYWSDQGYEWYGGV